MKLEEWKAQAHCAGHVYLDHGVTISLPPSSKRASFPYDSLPSFRLLTIADVLKEFVRVPNITETCVSSFCLGAAFTLVLTSSSSSSSPSASFFKKYLLHLKKFLFLAIISFMFKLYCQVRQVQLVEVNDPQNVSSNIRGPCRVLTRVLALYNSHAGAHADQPYHFLPSTTVCSSTSPEKMEDVYFLKDKKEKDETQQEENNNNKIEQISRHQSNKKKSDAELSYADLYNNPQKLDEALQQHPSYNSTPVSERFFDPCMYNGDCILVDLSAILQEKYGKRGGQQQKSKEEEEVKWSITAEILNLASHRYGVDFTLAWRVLFCTRTLLGPERRSSDAWDGAFAHFSKDGAEFLGMHCPKLLLVGIDTPSVDHPDAAPICENSHGTFYNCQVAFLENLDFSKFYPILEQGTNSSVSTHPKCGLHNNEAEEGGRPIHPVLTGSVQTIFNPMQAFPDSKGCVVLFYPTPDCGTGI